MTTFNVLDLDAVIADISAELREQMQRIGRRAVEDERDYFEAVRQRMPALTGNAATAVTFSVQETPTTITVTTRQEDTGASGDPIAQYMPEGILAKAPHTSSHTDFEQRVATAKVGHVVINPSAAQDPWRQAAIDLKHTNFRREGRHPTRILSDPPGTREL